MKPMALVIFATAIASLLTPFAAHAATKADSLSSCIEGALSPDESEVLLTEILEWTHLYTDANRENVGACYEKLTGELAAFVQGEGLVFGSEAQQVIVERQRLQAKAEAETIRRNEAVLRQSMIREELKCSLLEEWDVLSGEKAAADDVLNADELVQDARKSEAYIETYMACSDWFSTDRISALTSAVCSPMFRELGLPDSEISGPTYAEVVAAQTVVKETTVNLTTITSSLRQVERDEDYVNRYSEEDLYDVRQALATVVEQSRTVEFTQNEEATSKCEILWWKWKSEN